ncbi:MAG: hypothetical protein NTY75_02445 [Candidatus Shapirobacteria bacterium]|nr:hypothetical protein [Candidatus Shapirobacteria bacterium]
MKNDDQKFFTVKDGENLRDELSAMIDVKLDNKLGDLDEKLFKWKSEIFDAVDSVAKEMNESQEFREITTNQIVEVEERTGKLEKKVFGAC